MKAPLALAFLTIALANLPTAQSRELERLWETEPVLPVPESVLVDTARGLLFVSNIEGEEPWGKDFKGSIGKLALDGKVIDPAWIKGLHAPKGMGLHGDLLYVADVDHLVVIDVSAGAVAAEIAVPGAQRLNDVSVGTDGTVYVSDSQTGTIHAVRDGNPFVFIGGFFKSPNGVLAADGVVYVLDRETLYRVGSNKLPVAVVDGLKGHVDGVEKVGEDTFVVSCWNGVVYFATVGHTPVVLLDTRDGEINAADIGYDAGKGIVYVPTFWKNSVAAYQIK